MVSVCIPRHSRKNMYSHKPRVRMCMPKMETCAFSLYICMKKDLECHIETVSCPAIFNKCVYIKEMQQ